MVVIFRQSFYPFKGVSITKPKCDQNRKILSENDMIELFLENLLNPFYKSIRIYVIITFVFVGKTNESNSE